MRKFTLNALLALVFCLAAACENKREGGDNYSTPTEKTGSGESDEKGVGSADTDTASTKSTSENANVVAGKPMVPAYTADADFVTMAGSGSMLEIELGKIAAKKGMAADVKKFGQHLVDDHSKANSELKSLAVKKKWTVPAKMNAEHQASFDRISKMTGKDFDREFVTEMVKDHEEDVALFEQATQKATDADLKAFTSKTLPALRMHLDMARQIDMKMNNAR